MLHPYIRLMRLHQPTGIFLLYWPCAWAIAMASTHAPSPALLLIFGLGAVVMRSAGCIVNDIIDREVDRNVARTRTRPLASGEVTLLQALTLLLLLLVLALTIVLLLPRIVLYLACVSLLLVAAYPFMKRLTWWPQAFLGLTFNWGTLMGWAAVTGGIAWPTILLYAGGVFWTLGYDTIYAHQDKADDTRAGVKSTALKLGADSTLWIAGFYAAVCLCWLAAGYLQHCTLVYYIGLIGVCAHLLWQVQCVDLDEPASCMNVFQSNTMLGAIMFAVVLLCRLF